MAISTQSMFELKAAKFGANQNNSSFQEKFFFALTRTINDLNSPRVGLSISIPADMNEDIDTDEQYFGVVSDGLDLYLQTTGEFGNDDPQVLEGRYRRSLGQAQTMYQTDNPPDVRITGEE